MYKGERRKKIRRRHGGNKSEGKRVNTENAEEPQRSPRKKEEGPMRQMAKMGILALVMMVCVCSRGGAQGTPVEGTVEATGKLVKVMAAGAETTGWAIQFEDEVSFGGKRTQSIEVEGDAKKFGKLENKKVTAKGTIVHRPGAESKDRMVFVVEKIKEWKAPQAERPSSY
jgi:hypothetical protein